MTKAAELAKMGEVLTNSQIGGRRNIVINGAMQVAQRGTSFTGVGNGDNGYKLDRFKFAESGSPNGEFTITRASDGPSGFANSMKLDCTTAETTLNDNEMIRIIQGNEGQNLQHLKKGTSDAESLTLSFYVKSNLTGTAVVGLYDNDNGRYNARAYTIDSANTWERKVLTFQGDTTGTLANDNGLSMEVWFYLQAGGNKTSGTLPSNWEALVEANSAPGQTINVASSTDNDFFITGIQLEVGEQATPFEHRSFGEELALCQRYYERIHYSSTVDYDPYGTSGRVLGAGVWYSASTVLADFQFRTTKRATAAVSVPDSSSILAYVGSNGRSSTDATPFDLMRQNNARINASSWSVNGTLGDGAMVQLQDNKYVEIDAEL
jgi:hypothetical protein